MERDNRNRFYHGGLGDDNWRDGDRRARNGAYGRDDENRYRGGENQRDFGHRRDSDSERFRDYHRRDREMEQHYYQNTRGEHHSLGNIRQGYGFSSFEDAANQAGELDEMRREREALRQQGYGSGRLRGYSGAGFGGANYSVHGDLAAHPAMAA